MAKQFGSQVDLQKIPVLGIVPETGASAPGSPVNGQLWVDSSGSPAVIKAYENGSFQRLLGQSGGGGPPTGAAGGDLAGSTYPNPVIAALAVTAAKIANATITDTQVAAANKDGVAGTYSLRTLGLGALQALAGNTTLDAVTAPAADLNLNSKKITSLANPVSANDAANKLYVDNAVEGLDWKASVKVATTVNITLSGTQTIDGVAVVVNDRVLVKNQTNTQDNGIYFVGSGLWQRALDMNLWTEVPGAATFVEQGTQADTGWVCTADQGGTLNTTPITWSQFSSSGAVVAGTGLTQTGQTINAIGTAARISVGADNIDIDAAYVGQASITTLGTIAAGTWQGNVVQATYGGTGGNTANQGRINLGAAQAQTVVCAALVAGVELSVLHTLNSLIVHAQFRLASTKKEVVFDWRVIDATHIGITADIAYSASAIEAVLVNA
jgi:hypothetical protein